MKALVLMNFRVLHRNQFLGYIFFYGNHMENGKLNENE